MVFLAPMEGLLDPILRDVLTRVGGIDRCVSEFIRITDQLLPERVFTRLVPELLTGGRTPSGVPVHPQLLGSDPGCLAENAARLAQLRPQGIDLNFGCPAKCVNRHRGGAVLLDEPELIHAIVAAVRRAVPAEVGVTAKMRLGFRDAGRALECAQAIHAGGASELVVHARTRDDGYRPPAYWERIAPLRAALPASLVIVANGEIWNVEDARRARERSGCEHLMLGRGLVADPALGLQVNGQQQGPMPWPLLLPLMQSFFQQVRARVAARHQGGRLKQWLHYLRRCYPQAEAALAALRTENDAQRLADWMAQEDPEKSRPEAALETLDQRQVT